MKSYRFKFSWLKTVAALLAISLFLSLGNWQLHRAAEKKQMLSSETALSKQSPTDWTPQNTNPRQYQSVCVTGRFLTPILLLDNQHHEHQFGYNVLSALQLTNNQVLLVDRGWVKGDISRRQLPEVTTPSAELQLQGQVYYPSAKAWVLGQVLEKKSDNLAIIEKIDPQIISQFLHKSVYPFIIRLNKKEENGFLREWAIVSMPPERHKAYAFQWFAIALAIFIMYVGLSVKKINEKNKT